MNNKPDSYLSIKECSVLLGVSSATVRNWIRQGYLTPDETGKCFRSEEASALKLKIERGELERLQGRANKAASARRSIPAELIKNKKSREKIAAVVDYITDNQVSVSEAMYFLAINHLVKNGMPGFTNPPLKLIEKEFSVEGYSGLTAVLAAWRNEITFSCSEEIMGQLINFSLPEGEDIPGIIYQSLAFAGDKSRGGSFYTPSEVIRQIADEYGSSSCRFIDPCCGTGAFLTAFAEKGGDPENIYGIDIDLIAVNIARINMILRFRDRDFMPKIFHGSALTGFENENWFRSREFDVAATNPPWGAHLTAEEALRCGLLFPEITSGESFSYFLKKGISLVKKGGAVIYILPEALLNISVHRDIRKIILSETRIKKIQFLEKAFKNVFTSVITAELINENVKGDAVILRKGLSSVVNTERFLSNPDYIFDTDINSVDESIISRIYRARHVTLKGKARWALGIVTGNNSRFLAEAKADPGYEPVYRGKDLKPYIFSDPALYIKFQPSEYQQCAPEQIFRVKEKLVYKFISNKPVFAYDDAARLTLNSANILIPEIPELNIKVILAFLNSGLFAYLYKKKFSSIKILRSHLEELPFPLLNKDQGDYLTKMANLQLNGENLLTAIDEFIFSIYGFSDEDKEIIRGV